MLLSFACPKERNQRKRYSGGEDFGFSIALPQMPFPGLLRNGPPTARLRKLQACFLCHRQRKPAILLRTTLIETTKRGEKRAAAAGGRQRQLAFSAAVEKRKEQRKPAAFFGHRKVETGPSL